MLLEDVNLLIGKIIGLLNGLDGDPSQLALEDDIRSSLNAIYLKEDLKPYINKMIENKKTYLPNCLTCVAPCGRTNDFYINEIENSEYRTIKENELNFILYNQKMEYKDLVVSLEKLSW